jgi:serine/threonine protein kinase/WD40 repeat protein
MTGPSAEHDPLQPVADEFLDCLRRGEHPSLSVYKARFPDLADRIDELFPALAELELVGSDAGSSAGSPSRRCRGHVTAERLGDFRILREVGRGGMGVVYEAVQESLGRRVALKVLPRSGRLGGSRRERFRLEARSAARLHHSNIVPVYGVGEHDGSLYYAMQFINGHGLDAVIDELRRVWRDPSGAPAPDLAPTLLSGGLAAPQRRPAEPPAPDPRPATEATEGGRSGLVDPSRSAYFQAVARVGVQVAEALAHAHQQGVLHRDIKPSNLLIDADGTVWVTDFGLAKEEDSDGLTATGDVLGTLRYMAPERFDGWSDRRSDVYGLGATMYELATLTPAFPGDDRPRLVERVLREPPTPPRKLDPHVPRDLETIILKAMAKEPADRFASAADMADDLRRFLDNRPLRSRPASAVERARRWCRRNPVPAGLGALAAALTLAVAVVSSTAALTLKRQRDVLRTERTKTLAALGRARQAERDRKEELGRSYLAQASATRNSRRAGQRFETLKAIARAAGIARDSGSPPATMAALRDEAIAALALPDVREAGSLGKTADGYRGLIVDARFKLYAQYDRTGNVIVRRIADDSEVARLEGRPGLTDCWVEFAPDGRSLRVSTYTWLRLWRLDAAPTLALDIPPNEFRRGAVAFSPDGRELAYASESRPLARVEIATGRVTPMPPVRGLVTGIVYHPDGRRLAVIVNREGHCTLEVRTADDPGPSASVAVPALINSPVWRQDGRLLVVAGGDNRLYVWMPDRGTLQALEGLHSSGVMLAFSRDGTLLASNGWDSRLRLWDLGSGRVVLSMPVPNHDGMQFGLDGRTLTGPAQAQTGLRLFEVADGREYRSLTVGGDVRGRAGWFLGGGAISPDGRLLALCRDGPSDGIRLWDIRRGEEVAVFDQYASTFTSALFAGDGALLTCGPRGLHRWPPHADGRFGPAEVLAPDNLSGGRLACSRDGRVIAATRFDAGTLVVHRDNLGLTVRLAPQRDVRQVAVSPDGRWVAAGTWNGTDDGVFVWDSVTGAQVARLPSVDCCALGFSPDGAWLAVGTQPGPGRLWRVGSWSAGPSVEGGGALQFSPDGALLAQAGRDHRIRLFDPRTAHPIATLEDPNADRSEWFAWGFTPDGTSLVALGDMSRSVHIWDLRLIRRGLASLGLDWDRPPYPDAPPSADAEGPTVRIEPGDALSVLKRALDHYGAERWPQAADDYARLVKLQPQVPTLWCGYAFLRLIAGDLTGYQAACSAMLDRFAGKPISPLMANQLSRACCLATISGSDADRAVKIAEAARAARPRHYTSVNLHAAALYRAGRYAEAIEAFDEAMRIHGRGGTSYDHAFLAMIHHDLGHPDEALISAERAARWTAQAGSGAIDDPLFTTPLHPSRRLELQALGREVSALLGR